MTQADVEVPALYPRVLALRPAIAVTVQQPHTVKVAVVGAVEEPAVHELSSDRLSLTAC